MNWMFLSRNGKRCLEITGSKTVHVSICHDTIAPGGSITGACFMGQTPRRDHERSHETETLTQTMTLVQ